MVRGQWGYSESSKTSWIRLHAATGAMAEWLGHWIPSSSQFLSFQGGSKLSERCQKS